MKPHDKPLSLEKEQEEFERLMRWTTNPEQSDQDTPTDFDSAGHYVVTQFGPTETDGERIIGQATSLRGALRSLARHIHQDGQGGDEALLATHPLSRLEMDALEDVCSAMESHTQHDDAASYVGEILEEHPDLELVIGWGAIPPAHDLGLGIYRGPAKITETTRRIARQASPSTSPQEPRPPAPAKPAPPVPLKTPAKWSIN